VNPLTDLSRSYLICLSQRGVEEARKGEREREREREREGERELRASGDRGESNRELEGCPDVPEDTGSPSHVETLFDYLPEREIAASHIYEPQWALCFRENIEDGPCVTLPTFLDSSNRVR